MCVRQIKSEIEDPLRSYGRITLHNFCEECNVEVSHTLVKKIIANENHMSTKLDLINSYTTSSSAKVIETITDYFKEHM